MVNQRGAVLLFILTALLLATCIKAKAADLPQGINCERVRELVAEHGKARALAWALENGVSFGTINEARKCLKGR